MALKETSSSDETPDFPVLVFTHVGPPTVHNKTITVDLTGIYRDLEKPVQEAGAEEIVLGQLLMNVVAARRLRDVLTDALLLVEPAASQAEN